MRKLRLRKGFWIILPAFMLAFFASPVKAETYTTSGAQDFYFSIQEASTFSVRTFAWQNGIDSMLWLYDSDNQLITANDDYYGLDSFIEIILQPGEYRLRTGVCCWDPERWYGSSYSFETNIAGYTTSTTIVPETTTTQPEIPETTTTVEETTTTTSTTTTVETTTVPETIPTPEVTTVPEISISQNTIANTTTTITISAPVVTTTTTVTPTTTQAPIIEDSLINILNDIENINTTEIVNFINNAISDGLSEDEAILIASTPEVLNSITTEQAKEIFKSLDLNSLSTEQEKQLAESLSSAPEEIKNEFENSVDIFGEGFDEYVPNGSSIDVGTRRAIIAVTAVATSITMTAPSAGTPSASSGSAGTSGDRSSNRSRRN